MRQLAAERSDAGAEARTGRRRLAVEQCRLDHFVVVAEDGKGLQRQSGFHVLAIQAGHRSVAVQDEPQFVAVDGTGIQIAQSAAGGLVTSRMISASAAEPQSTTARTSGRSNTTAS